jgi:hypothetical protein
MYTDREACIFVGSLSSALAISMTSANEGTRWALAIIGIFCLLWLAFTKPNVTIKK